MGSVAGFYRGSVDNIIMWFINVVWSIPTILLAMAIRFAIGDKINSFLAIFIAVGLSMWVEVARMRVQVSRAFIHDGQRLPGTLIIQLQEDERTLENYRARRQ